MVFFIQARNGIRDLGRSRGLGEVYKRQIIHHLEIRRAFGPERVGSRACDVQRGGFLFLLFLNLSSGLGRFAAASYTHLTLPTISSV